MLQFSARSIFLTILMSFSLPVVLACAVVTLEWEENTEPDLKGYILSYGLESGEYTETILMGQQTRISVGGLEEGTEYFFALQAYDRTGNTSELSDEISHVVQDAGDDDLDLITPNGGEKLPGGSSHSIEWVVIPGVEKIRIFVSTDGGDSWELVKGNTKNDGHWLWTIPDFSSDQCLMKIEEYQNPDIYDVSLDFFSIGETVGIDSDAPPSRLPRAVRLHQNYPNPFNPVTTISFDVSGSPDESAARLVTISVYDTRGRHVRTLVEEVLAPGTHSVCWDGRTERGEIASSGIYFYHLRAGKETTSPRKMVLAR